MKDVIINRLKEPSTYLGLALVVKGVGSLAKLDHAEQAADVLQGAAEPLARGDYATGLALLLGGLLGVFLPERKKK